MAALPDDIAQAIGITATDLTWVRVRSSPGSVVGETFIVDTGGAYPRVWTRPSALDSLVELPLDAEPTFDESTFDAHVSLVTGGDAVKLDVGYLDRDDVRSFFQRAEIPAPSPPPSPASSPASPPVPSPTHASAELTDLRCAFVTLLSRRAHPPPALVARSARQRLVELLQKRVHDRKRTLLRRRDATTQQRAAEPPRSPDVAANARQQVSVVTHPTSSRPARGRRLRDDPRPDTADRPLTGRVPLWLVAAIIAAAIAALVVGIR